MRDAVTTQPTAPVRKRRSPPAEQRVLEPERATPRNRRLAAAVAADPRPVYLIAAEARFAPTTLSQVVGGSKVPSPERCERLAAVLGIPVEQLFGDQPLIIAAT